MSQDTTFDAPFRGALTISSTVAGGTAEVPGKWDVAINGHGYMIDMEADLQGFRGEHFKRASVPILREQADTANTPGEQSINRESLWRRSQESWHHGSGQQYLDRSDSDPYRFNTSLGVNVWNKWTLSLLNDTSLAKSSSSVNLRLASAGSTMYLADGNNLSFTTDLSAFTTVTGTPASACNWVTTDGYNIWAAYGAAVFTTTRGAASATSFSTGYSSNVTLIGYVKGRLMVAAGPSLWNITASGAIGSALYTQPNSDWAWVGFGEGPGFIYAAGYSGNRSLIYKTAVLPDGTALNVPSVGAELPIGETIRSIKGYLGLIIVGTDLGFRVGNPDSQGNITFGALIKTGSPVLNFEPGDRFLWYTVANYDGTHTGLGRMDLSVFTDTLVPAYATDLMYVGQGSVLSISTFAGKRIFTVSGVGVVTEASTLVQSCTFTTGRITYGVGDNKVALFLDLRHQALAGSIDATLSANGTTSVSLGSSGVANSVSSQYGLNAGKTIGEFFEIKFTLSQGTSTTGPVMTRSTLRAYPTPPRTLEYVVPLIFQPTVADRSGNPNDMDVASERAFIEKLVTTGALAVYQEGSLSSSVLVDNFDWIPIHRVNKHGTYTFEGTMVVTLKEQTA